MTKTYIVDCDKWQKVIGITLWVGATIGLTYGLVYVLVSWLPSNFQVCTTDTYFEHSYTTCNLDVGRVFLLFVAAVANLINGIVIWIVLNGHYEWIEIRCKDSGDES